MVMSLSRLQELVMDREAWHAAFGAVPKSQSDWSELNLEVTLLTGCLTFASASKECKSHYSRGKHQAWGRVGDQQHLSWFSSLIKWHHIAHSSSPGLLFLTLCYLKQHDCSWTTLCVAFLVLGRGLGLSGPASPLLSHRSQGQHLIPLHPHFPGWYQALQIWFGLLYDTMHSWYL